MTAENTGAPETKRDDSMAEPSLLTYGFMSIIVTIFAVVVPGDYVLNKVDINDVIGSATSFRAFAISATVVAALASLFRLIAHGDSQKKNLDGFGKQLGLVAAVLAVFAAWLLFVIDTAKISG